MAWRLQLARVNRLASIGAGLFGIERELEPPIRGNAYDAKRRPALGPQPVRGDAALAGSRSAKELSGTAFVEHDVISREVEFWQAEAAVTDWERARYFDQA